MDIRRAKKTDIDGILVLLGQVLTVHHEARPDLFRKSGSKYSFSELESIIGNEKTPVFVAFDGKTMLGYAFCVVTEYRNNNIFYDMKTLYVDDICVDSSHRRCGVGKSLFEYVKKYASDNGFYNITLNVWNGNPAALRFYESCGMSEQKRCMELILK